MTYLEKYVHTGNFLAVENVAQGQKWWCPNGPTSFQSGTNATILKIFSPKN
jgi:hypothetical protein